MDFRPFRALRPQTQFAAEVAALPYDVMNTEEARGYIADKPRSFMRIDRAETAFEPGHDAHADEVYAKARELLDARRADTYIEEKKPCFYLYRQIMDGRAQLGLVGTVAARDSLEGRVKKHEMTRADKEADRIRHVDTLSAHTGPIFLTYRKQVGLTEIMNNWILHHDPVYNFKSAEGVHQTVWVVDDAARIAEIQEEMADCPALYIADGHHRHASAVRVAQERRAALGDAWTGDEEFNYYLAVLFAADELKLMDYNRVIRDLNGLSIPAFIAKLEKKFEIEKAEEGERVRPRSPHCFGMALGAQWYHLRAKDGTYDPSDPVGSLDVSLLQENVIAPILGITDPRTDTRIDFVGGIRGLRELERRATSDMQLAFALYPTSVGELMAIADAGEIMPPKSTWFEPKLLSGLFIHTF
ncbi:MAG: DUF1015 family protein [Oscillospiraceae bacterium]|jgi:uncharacterized protein (DUF1015 family)|nr:DUF1015 family protein [Oscillospiraceae bacterium]